MQYFVTLHRLNGVYWLTKSLYCTCSFDTSIRLGYTEYWTSKEHAITKAKSFTEFDLKAWNEGKLHVSYMHDGTWIHEVIA